MENYTSFFPYESVGTTVGLRKMYYMNTYPSTSLRNVAENSVVYVYREESCLLYIGYSSV